MSNRIIKDTIAITVITLVAGLALGVVQDITADPIAKQEAQAKQDAYKAVFADADSFETVDVNTDTMNNGSVSGADYANRAVDLDPNDIESINILKGPCQILPDKTLDGQQLVGIEQHIRRQSCVSETGLQQGLVIISAGK